MSIMEGLEGSSVAQHSLHVEGPHIVQGMRQSLHNKFRQLHHCLQSCRLLRSPCITSSKVCMSRSVISLHTHFITVHKREQHPGGFVWVVTIVEQPCALPCICVLSACRVADLRRHRTLSQLLIRHLRCTCSCPLTGSASLCSA